MSVTTGALAAAASSRLPLVVAFSSNHPSVLPIAARDLFVEAVLVGDAGFAVVLLEVVIEAAKGRLGRIAVLIGDIKLGRVAVLILVAVRLPLHVVGVCRMR